MDFNAWCGAKDTLKQLVKLGKTQEVEDYINDCMTDPTDTQINDFLWHDDKFIAVDILNFKNVDEFYMGGK